MTSTIITDHSILDHIAPILPTRGCNDRAWANYVAVSAVDDLSDYEYIQFTKSDSTMAFVMVLDFDRSDALDVIQTLPTPPDWIIRGGERPGRSGYAQCGYFIAPVNKNVMRGNKRILATVYGADLSDNDSYLRNPFYAAENVTIYSTVPRDLSKIVTEDIKVKAWKLEKSNKVFTEYERIATRSYGNHVDYTQELKSTKNGARDDTLWKAIRQRVMVDKITDREEAIFVAHSMNNQLEEPLDDKTVENKVDSVFKGKDAFAVAQSNRGKKAAAHRTFKSNQLNELRIQKHDAGMTWKEIAEEEGKNLEAVERAVIRYRKRIAT